MYFIWGPWDPDPERRAGVPKVLDPGADVSTLRAALEELTYDELVSAWGSSDRRLRSETDLSRRGAVVALRGLMLDELERRSSWRYRRWLRLGGPSRRPAQRRSAERRSAERRSAQRRRPPGGGDPEDATPV
jgi:hypothetical protein